MKPSKFIILISFVFLSFTLGDSKSEYLVARAAYSLCTIDYNLDESTDVIIGHNYNSQTNWGGISIMENDGGGFFEIDSFFLFDHHYDVFVEFVDNNNFYDLITQYSENGQPRIAIVYDFVQNQNNIQSLQMSYTADFIAVGDVSENGSIDILVANNNDFLWGIIYNDGTGNFSPTEYYDLAFPPVDIICDDLNDDGRDDVVIYGSSTEIYFSTESGFQQQYLGYTWTGGCTGLISDFDNDNDNDILVAGSYLANTNRIYMFENLGNNQFFEHDYFEFSPFCSYAQISDFNNDSLPDMVFIDFDNEGLYIYNNLGNFQLEFDQFINVENYNAMLNRIKSTDFDKNGYNDIVGVIYSHYQKPSNVYFLFNNGQGGFQENPVTKIKNQKSKIKNQIFCYPNPFNDKTTISICSDNDEIQILKIYDLQGKLIKAFIDKNIISGMNEFIWKGKDLNGKEVQPGIYLVRLQAGRNVYTQRVVFL